ncbi:MAG TPA: PAS domain S-box protein [Opitutaceae bacterium]|nr:PAS domain S-box protein [Opitutaceae bacterium]
MGKPLRCLIVEDSESDALLVVQQLRSGGYDVKWERVETAEAMRAALGRQPWDVVIGEFKLAHFDGPPALELLKASGRGVPFIIVSGTIGEDQAVAAMKAGAHDYLMKGKLARLVPSVERELRDAVEWRARRRTEMALQKSEQKYRELVEHANSIILRWTRDGRILFLNEFGQKFFGYTEAEILGRQIVGTIVPESESTSRDLRPLMEQIGANPEAFEQSINENMRRNGERVWVAWTNKLVLDEQGRTREILSIGSDITERRRVEAAMRETQSFYLSLVEQLPAGVFRKDREGRYVFVSAWFCRLKGMEAGEFLGKTPQEVAAVEAAKPGATDLAIKYSADGMDHHALIMQTGKPIEVVEEYTDAAGRKQFVHALKIPVFGPDGTVVGTQGILFDITALKLSEARNREQAALLDTANDAIYVTTLDCTILFWSRGAERTYGWTSAEAVNRKTTELVSPDVAAIAALNRVLLEQGSWSGERGQMTKSGRRVEVFSRLTLVRDEQGQPQSVFAINTDITEKKQLEAQFLRSQRLESIGALASGIAHDLNNVLTPILMGTPLLREAVRGKEARDMVAAIEASAARGAEIVKRVLTFARGVPGERVPLQPRHLILEMVKIAGETFPKNIRIENAAPGNLWAVQGDATQIHQALMNLCVNARDAMPAGGVLRLTAENVMLDEAFAKATPEAKPGPHVCLGVADTGTGIPPENLDKLFAPFFTTKAPGQGTGLGLSTVLGIARSHGGFVKVRTEVGEGTTFEIYLPAFPTAEIAAGLAPGSAPPWGNGELILVVDDEEAIREVTRKVLETCAYKVMTAAEGLEAIGIFGRQHRDIKAVITDMMMPGMDGPSLVAALRAIEPGIKIIGISGVGERTGVTNLQALALPAYLAKPFPIQKLLRALHEVLHPPESPASA